MAGPPPAHIWARLPMVLCAKKQNMSIWKCIIAIHIPRCYISDHCTDSAQNACCDNIRVPPLQKSPTRYVCTLASPLHAYIISLLPYIDSDLWTRAHLQSRVFGSFVNAVPPEFTCHSSTFTEFTLAQLLLDVPSSAFVAEGTYCCHLMCYVWLIHFSFYEASGPVLFTVVATARYYAAVLMFLGIGAIRMRHVFYGL